MHVSRRDPLSSVFQVPSPTRNAIRHDSLRMAVDNRVGLRIPLKHLAMDAALRVSGARIGIHGFGIFNPVLDQVGARGDRPGRNVFAHDEDARVPRVADGEVAVGIDDPRRC